MIAEFQKVVVDVTDLDRGLKFWSELTGLKPTYADPAGKFMGLGKQHEQGGDSIIILLQLVTAVSSGGGTHIDLKVNDVQQAIVEVEKIGGTVKKVADSYPDTINPQLEWAVMQDPFGNPFCLIRYVD